ncbi:MAG TPA: endolytic transglycosylase MltG [Bacteroidales bacterium]|jgi:UPF0755 protein|nr:endolytic transglycosylase MltG [Bacteroidales bacterium]
MHKSWLKYVILLLMSVLTISIYLIYNQFFGVSITPEGGKATLLIPEDATFRQAMDSVEANLIIKNKKILEWVAEKKKYQKLVKPGKYVIDRSLSYNELINILRGGKQTPVRITFINLRTLNDIAGRIGGLIEADSTELMDFFSDPENYNSDGFKRENVISVFIPDTYEFYWNTRAGKLYNRMLREYRKFWTRERLQKSEEIGLTPVEVSTLASIIDEEALKTDEKPRIAGVYLNRLKRGIPLQADPTIKYAINNFTVNRILYKHLEVESPYNTYKHAGLPPGPIGCPSVNGIDAVLNAEKHDFIYFAAKSDFSGYHNFSRTLSEHNRYANQYQRELNKRRIYR